MKIETPAKGKPITIHFVRHGESEGQKDESLTDPDLTELGREQALATAKYLEGRPFDHIYFSTLKRARQTAEPITKALSNVPYNPTEELMEVSQSHFLLKPDQVDPDEVDLLERQHDIMDRFINRILHEHGDGGRLLVIAHGNIIASLMAYIGGKKPYESVLLVLDNASVSIVQYWAITGMAVVRSSNNTSHLRRDQITA